MNIEKLNKVKEKNLKKISGIGGAIASLLEKGKPYKNWKEVENVEFVTQSRVEALQEAEVCKSCYLLKDDCRCGRPTKLNEEFLQVAEEVVNDEINAIIYTDKELVDEINWRLDDEKKEITHRTFKNWKKKVSEGKKSDLGVTGRKFFHLYEKALRDQKNELFREFKDDEKKWQKWAWIIERKFDDWNLKHKTEHSGEIANPTPILKLDEE